jgi:hypothetical protein
VSLIIRIIVAGLIIVLGYWVLIKWQESAVADASALFNEFTTKRSLDAAVYEYIGVTSGSKPITVRSWRLSAKNVVEQIDVTTSERLVCRWRQASASIVVEDLGCVQFE